MALTVNFYSFGKKDNSTKRPETAAQSVNCVLKDGCGILAPVLILDMSAVEDISGLNYAYIADFGRYYFVDEWTWERGVWIASMSVDPLATWKEAIGGSTHYILRSSFASDGTIMDTTYPTKSTADEVSNDITSTGFASNFKNGTYIVSIIAGTSGEEGDPYGLGGVSYYWMTYQQFNKLVNYLMSDDFLNEMTFTDISNDTMKAFMDPFKYITGAMWIPTGIPGIQVSDLVKVGWWTLPEEIQGFLIDPTDMTEIVITKSGTVSIPKHPQAATRGDYLNLSPYSRYTFAFGPFGEISLDSTLLAGHSSIAWSCWFDCITGKGILSLFTDSKITPPVIGATEIGHYTAQIGVPIQLSAMERSLAGYAGTALTNAAGAVLDLFGAPSEITGAVNGIGNAYVAQETTPLQKGGTGSIVDYTWPGSLRNNVLMISDEYNAHIGRPLNQARQISTIPGYIKCLDGDVEFPGTSAEISAVKAALEGGFFYE